MLSLAFLTFSSFIPRFLLGFLILQLLWSSLERKYLLVKIFLSGAIGFGISSLFSFLWIWVGFSLNAYVVTEITLAGLLTFLMFNKNLSGIGYWPEFNKSGNRIWSFLLMIGMVIFMINLIFFALKFPHGRVDAWSNWNVVSRFIYRGGTDWENTFLRLNGHPDYPLFIPINNALTWAYLQRETFIAAINLHFVFSICIVGLFFSCLNALKGLKQATLATIVFLTHSYVAETGISQLADFPLSYMILAVGGLTLLWFEIKEKKLVVLVGFITGLAAWTKNEGIILVIIVTIVWFLIQWIYKDPVFMNYIWGMIFPAIVVILFKTFLAPSNEILSPTGGQNISEKFLNIERYTIILQAYVQTMIHTLGSVGIVGFVILYIFVVGRTQKEINGLWVIGVMIIFQLSAYFMIYLMTPHDLAWHLATSQNRLYYHIYPLILLGLFTWLKSPDELMEEKT